MVCAVSKKGIVGWTHGYTWHLRGKGRAHGQACLLQQLEDLGRVFLLNNQLGALLRGAQLLLGRR